MAEKDERYWDKVENYLLRKSSELEETEDFVKDANLQQQLEDGIAFAGRADLKNRLQRIHQEEVAEGNAKIRRMTPRRRILQWSAAAAILLLGVLAVTLYLPSNVEPTALYQEHYQPYALDLTLRGQKSSSLVSRLEVMYNRGNFTGALPLLDEALATENVDPRLQLARVMANWETGNRDRALAELQELQAHPLVGDQAYWYAALFALGQEQVDQACQNLASISDRGGQWFENAATLQKKLACPSK